MLKKAHLLVRPAKAGAFNGSQSHRGKSQTPVTWVAGRREIEVLKPTDKAIARMVSESPGRNASERSGGPERTEVRRPSPHAEGEGNMTRRSVAEAAGHSGGVGATAR
jgi:hypothetical protein